MVCDFFSMILCKRNLEDLFFSQKCVGGIKCIEYGDLELFYRNFPIDSTHPRLSNIMVTWKRHEYVTMNQPCSQIWNWRGSTFLRIIFLFQNSWGSFKIRFIILLSTLTSAGGKLMNFRIHTWYLSKEQSYHWHTSFRIAHFLPRERYRVSTIIHTKCLHSYISCTNMHMWMLRVGIALLSHIMWLRSTISTLTVILSTTHCFFNIALALFLNHLEKMTCHS